MNKFRSKLSLLLKALIFFWAIFALSVFLVLAQTWLYPLFSKGIMNTHNLSPDIIQKNYKILIRYNLNPRPVSLEFMDLSMSEHGRIHFEEVKTIFQSIIWSGLLALALSIFFITRAGRNKEKPAFIPLGGLISLILPLLIGLLITVLGFDRTFVIFHKIFFDNDYWIFDSATDPIINYLPQPFFFAMAFSIILTYLIIYLLLRLILYPRMKAKAKL